MALKNFEKTVATLASKILLNRNEIARDWPCALPGVTFQTIDMIAMGTQSIPIPFLLDAMEASVTSQGISADTGLLSEGGDFEVRFAQMAINRFGGKRIYGCKAFFTGTPMSIPGFETTIGEATEGEFTYSVLKYRLLVDSKEALNIDRVNNIIVLNGKDYSKEIEQYL